MLIGLDAIPLTEPKTGVGHYTFELARALAANAPADIFELDYPSVYSPLPLDTLDHTVLPPNLRTVRVTVNSLTRHWWSLGLPAYIHRRVLQLFHGTNYDVPLWRRCPTVLTIHDLSLLLCPQTHERRRVRRARRRLPLMARQATLIITPTESVRREVCEHLSVSASKVVAVPEAPREIFRPLPPAELNEARRRLNIEEDFLLTVGTIEPRKNLITLVRAFEQIARLNPAHRQLRLIIAGARGWLNSELFNYINASSERERIRFTGYVSDEELAALYSSCAAFIYPSLYEGFGLPPLEAMACGAPVIASRIPSICEIVGNDAARLFDPSDADSLARSIIELLKHAEARRALADAGQKRAAQFTWERTARLTHEVYLEARRR